MTKARTVRKTAPKAENAKMVIVREAGETDGAALARAALEPYVRHGQSAALFAAANMANDENSAKLMDYAAQFKSSVAKAESGDLALASQLLTAQAITLDAMFTELARRSAITMRDYFNAAERYARLAMKAQANCRTTLEALAKLHQPREQTVRHVHVNEGGQAVVANEFHHHGGAVKTGVSNEQSHAPRNDGETASSAALPRPDAEGAGVPVPGGEGEKALQDARRD